jgi:Transposase domain (DUF772)
VSRATARQISFAELEMMRQGVRRFLDDHEEIVERVRRDLVRGLRKPKSGRRGLTPQQVLRSLILKRVKNWDYRELRERIADGMTLRRFTDFHCRPVPKHQAFHRDFNRLTPDTLRAINDLVVQAAVDLGLEDGSKLHGSTQRWLKPTFDTSRRSSVCSLVQKWLAAVQSTCAPQRQIVPAREMAYMLLTPKLPCAQCATVL